MAAGDMTCQTRLQGLAWGLGRCHDPMNLEAVVRRRSCLGDKDAGSSQPRGGPVGVERHHGLEPFKFCQMQFANYAPLGINKAGASLGYQKEGNGSLDIVFCAFRQRQSLHPEYFIIVKTCRRRRREQSTYPNNCRVIWHGWRGLVLLDARVLLDAEVLHIAAAEDDVLVNLFRWSNLVFGPASTTLGAKRTDIFQ